MLTNYELGGSFLHELTGIRRKLPRINPYLKILSAFGLNRL